MSDCPTCHQPIPSQAIACPYCQTPLRAFGHPGIPLHRTGTEAYLCQSCAYEADDTCTFPQRPYARECTLYVSQQQQQVWLAHGDRGSRQQPTIRWSQGLFLWLSLLGLLLISLLLALR